MKNKVDQYKTVLVLRNAIPREGLERMRLKADAVLSMFPKLWNMKAYLSTYLNQYRLQSDRILFYILHQ